MRKLSLKNAKDTLSRKEMRAVMGGSGGGYTGGGWCGTYSWTCARVGLYARTGYPDQCCSNNGSTGGW